MLGGFAQPPPLHGVVETGTKPTPPSVLGGFTEPPPLHAVKVARCLLTDCCKTCSRVPVSRCCAYEQITKNFFLGDGENCYLCGTLSWQIACFLACLVPCHVVARATKSERTARGGKTCGACPKETTLADPLPPEKRFSDFG